MEPLALMVPPVLEALVVELVELVQHPDLVQVDLEAALEPEPDLEPALELELELVDSVDHTVVVKVVPKEDLVDLMEEEKVDLREVLAVMVEKVDLEVSLNYFTIIEKYIIHTIILRFRWIWRIRQWKRSLRP